MTLHQIELDVAGTDGYEKRTEEYAERFNCKAEVITHDGPAGGNPLYRMIGKKEDLLRLFKNYCRQAYVPDVSEGKAGRPKGGEQVDEYVAEDVLELFDPEPYEEK